MGERKKGEEEGKELKPWGNMEVKGGGLKEAMKEQRRNWPAAVRKLPREEPHSALLCAVIGMRALQSGAWKRSSARPGSSRHASATRHPFRQTWALALHFVQVFCPS